MSRVTTIATETFLETLKVAEHSISPSSLIPIMRQFWFTGTHIQTYDDRTSVAIPFVSDFKGAVPQVLIDLVKNTRAATVEIEKADDGVLAVKLGRTRARLPFLPPSDFVFDMPDPGKPVPEPKGEAKKKERQKREQFVRAIEDCLKCIDEASPKADYMGVTIATDGFIYSTNRNSLCAAENTLDKKPREQIIVSASWCRQFVSLCKGKRYHINFTDDSVQAAAYNKDGDKVEITLFGRLLHSDAPLNFAKAIKSVVGANYREQDMSTLDRDVYAPLVERASIIAASRNAPSRSDVTVSRGKVKFVTESPDRGEVVDRMTLDSPAQEDVSLRIDPLYLRKIGDDVTQIKFFERAVMLRRGSVVFFVAATG